MEVVMRTLKQLAQDALNVQDASNLMGVVISFNNAMVELRRIYPSEGTEFINTHPIAQLWIDKLADLARCCDRDPEAFSKAYQYAKGMVDHA
jgi:hypothetical protein